MFHPQCYFVPTVILIHLYAVRYTYTYSYSSQYTGDGREERN